MPSWKKVIISGSNAELASLYAPSITGSLQGTASYALTASNVQGGTARYIPIWNTSSSLSSSAIYQSATGNVGIGILSPTVQLDVSGSVEIIGGASYMQDGSNVIYIAKGADTFYANTIGGSGAGTTGLYRQTVYGFAAGSLANGLSQTAVGSQAGYLNSASNQTAIGALAGANNSGTNQTAIGLNAGLRNSGSNQTTVGVNAGVDNSGSNQTAFGDEAGRLNSGGNQTSIGSDSGYQNTGVGQVAVGAFAGYQNSGSYQVAIGNSAGISNAGLNQVAVGYQAGRLNTQNYQTTVGYESGYFNTGINQSAFGWRAGYSNSGSNQVAVGQQAGRSNIGSDNTNIGYQAGYYTTGVIVNTGSVQSVFLGSSTFAGGGNRTNQIIIGYNAEGIGSNSVVLGNNSILTTALKGFVGIGITTPTASLHINNTSTSASFLVEDATNPDATSFVIDATGNVGIGTLTPTTKLTVQTSGSDDNLSAMIANFGKSPLSTAYGSAFIRVARYTTTSTQGAGDYTDIDHNSGGSSPHRYGTFGDTNIINGNRVTSGVYGNINFVTSGSTRMTIAGGTSAGRVGINKTSPNATLDVSGSAIISGSLTTTSSVAFKAYTSATSFPGTAVGYLAFDTAGNIITKEGVGAFPYTGSAQITGSLDITGSLIVTQGITGSLNGTASYAVNSITAQTASYLTNPIFKSEVILGSLPPVLYTTETGLPILSTNSIIINNSAGYITASISSTIIGPGAAQFISRSVSDVIIGKEAAADANNLVANILIGQEAGYSSSILTSNIAIGSSALANSDGVSDSISIGTNAGFNNNNVTSSIYIGYDAGTYTDNAYNNIIIGNYQNLPSGRNNSLNLAGVIFATASADLTEARVGIMVSNPTSASLQVNGNVWATSFTGSLNGTASFALTASFITASGVFGPYGANSVISASNALTASYSQNLQISGSINNVDYIDFNTGSAEPAWKSGRVYWNNTDGALSVYNAEADISLQVGQENWVRVRNDTGVLITNGTAVRLIGSHGDAPEIQLAKSIQVSGSITRDNQILGIATHDIENSSFGFVTTQGLIRGLNTSAYLEGDRLFVSSSAGKLTKIPPTAPYEIIPAAVVVKSGPGGSGILYAYPQQPMDFTDLSSVEIGDYTYGDILTYIQSGSVGVWRHTNQLSGSYGLTGSLNATSFTGSLNGTASFALTASNVQGGTARYIPIWNTSSSLSSSAIYQSATGNIGIGTTTPNATLDVNGNTIITGSLIVSGSLRVGGIIFGDGGTQLTGTTSITGSLIVTGSYASPAGNTIDSNALIQASLLYLSNNF